MPPRLTGRATRDGTAAFAADAKAAPGHFREAFGGLTLSSIGTGTHLGEPTDEHDALVTRAVTASLRAGVNVVDTALTYRGQRSERAVGAALRELAAEDPALRSRVLVSTKGGWLAPDSQSGKAPALDVEDAFLDTGAVSPEDVSKGYHALPGWPDPDGLAGLHAMTSSFLDASLEASRRNLGLDTVDLYYVHNPECELLDTPRDVVTARLRDAFAFLERAADEGRIGAYGVATWFAFRVRPDDPQHLALEELVALARDVGGHAHRLRAVQLPVNAFDHAALAARTQTVRGERVTALEAARRLGLTVFSNASIGQAERFADAPATLAKAFPEARSPGARALQFTRSLPGVACALVGMKTPAHVDENLALVGVPPADAAMVRALAPAEAPPAALPTRS